MLTAPIFWASASACSMTALPALLMFDLSKSNSTMYWFGLAACIAGGASCAIAALNSSRHGFTWSSVIDSYQLSSWASWFQQSNARCARAATERRHQLGAGIGQLTLMFADVADFLGQHDLTTGRGQALDREVIGGRPVA